MPTVVSFYVERPEEHPEAAARNYPGMLQALQRSCDAVGLAHVVLTDAATVFSGHWPDGVAPYSFPHLPVPLMRAATESYARYLEDEPKQDTLFVGADCLVLRDPSPFYPVADVCLTYRGRKSGMPINTGAMFVRKESVRNAAKLYRRVANQCGERWCDDQKSLCRVLNPLPLGHGIFNRVGLRVAFVPLDPLFNVIPNAPEDECADACVVHFKGKSRKRLFFDWASRRGFA